VPPDRPSPGAPRPSGRQGPRAAAARRRARPGAAPLTPTEHAALRDVARFGLLGAAHLESWHFGAATPSRLAALTQRGYLRVVRPRYAGRDVYLITAAGVRAAGGDLRPAAFIPALATHHLAVADVAAVLLRQYPGSSWITERELRRLAEGAPGQRTHPGHPPDGALRLNGQTLAVEVELTAKGPGSYRRILSWYAAALEYAAVVWFCAESALRRRLVALIEAEGLQGVAVVRPLPPGADAGAWG
jgi:hypothetical protein